MASASTTAQPPVRTFKCVPLENGWVLPGTKEDLKAIYRRPRRSLDEYDTVVQERAADGRPLWDIIGPLPMRRHSDWLAKGFEYVTVVAAPHMDGSGWPMVAASLRTKGLEPRDYLQHPVHGTWNPKLYMDSADRADVDKFAELRAAVELFGSKAVLAIRKQADPLFSLPESLMGIPAGGTVKTLNPAAHSDVQPGEITDRAGYEQAKAAGRIAEIPPTSKPAKRAAPKKKPAPAAPSEVQG